MPVPTLAALAAHLHDFHPIKPYHTDFSLACDPPTGGADFQDIKE